jgi:hypothetical protein
MVFQPFGHLPWSTSMPTIANKLSLAIRFTRIDRKVILMRLGHQSNSYNLMRNQEP